MGSTNGFPGPLLAGTVPEDPGSPEKKNWLEVKGRLPEKGVWSEVGRETPSKKNWPAIPELFATKTVALMIIFISIITDNRFPPLLGLNWSALKPKLYGTVDRLWVKVWMKLAFDAAGATARSDASARGDTLRKSFFMGVFPEKGTRF
jgi:hypothetical protein